VCNPTDPCIDARCVNDECHLDPKTGDAAVMCRLDQIDPEVRDGLIEPPSFAAKLTAKIAAARSAIEKTVGAPAKKVVKLRKAAKGQLAKFLKAVAKGRDRKIEAGLADRITTLGEGASSAIDALETP
jgi:hypothetical protein